MAKSTAKAKLDRSRPFATISSIKPQKAAYEQDGLLFDSYEEECGSVPGYVEKQKEETAKVEKKKAAKAKVKKAKAVEDLLGSLDDPNADVVKENAAAAAAENLADG